MVQDHGSRPVVSDLALWFTGIGNLARKGAESLHSWWLVEVEPGDRGKVAIADSNHI